MFGKSGLNKVLIAGYVALAVLVFSIVMVAVVFSSLYLRSNEVNSTTVHDYQYVQVDLHTNQVSKGFMSLNTFIKPDDFLSYVSENGDHVLVSNIGDEEYVCTGSCFCDSEESNRRGASMTLGRGLTYLVAATSTALAFQLAKNQFEGQCSSDLSMECPADSIHSEVALCNEVNEFSRVSKVDHTTEEGKELWDFDDETFDSYLCKGWCVHLHSEQSEVWDVMKEDIENNPCTKLKAMAEIKVYRRDKSEDELRLSDFNSAREKFREVYLFPMCGGEYEYNQKTSKSKLKRNPFDFVKEFQKDQISEDIKKSIENEMTFDYYCWEGDKRFDENVECRRLDAERPDADYRDAIL